MDKKDVSDLLQEMQTQLQLMLNRTADLSKEWENVVIENLDLKRENQYLRDRLQELGEDQSNYDSDGRPMSPAIQNLKNIYEEGFHICNISYGQRRTNNEQCVFCLEILYGSREEK